MRIVATLMFLVACGGDAAPTDDTGAPSTTPTTNPTTTNATTTNATTTNAATTATDTSDCSSGGGELPVGPCLTAQFAGTYAVGATEGSHQRGTIVIGTDGSVDYDDGLSFPVVDQEGVYDRLDCCNRVSVEMLQRPDNDTSLATDARHRVDLFTDGPSTTAALVSFEYYPNWPDEGGKVVLQVQ
jgi:hypothetical protein